MTSDSPVHAEDVLPVRSRISWAAILAGSVLAIAVYFLLTLLGSAIGLSLNGNVADRSLGIGAVVWAILVTAGCLFLGGFVASQLTTGENKTEAAMYGLLVWAAVFAALIWLMATGVRAGFNAIVQVASGTNAVAQNTNGNWEDVARRAGVSQDEINRARGTIKNAPENARAAANDPANQQVVEENTTKAAWYAFIGTLLSMIAAAVGGMVGSGPHLRIFSVRVARTGALDRRNEFVRTS